VEFKSHENHDRSFRRRRLRRGGFHGNGSIGALLSVAGHKSAVVRRAAVFDEIADNLS
jgi:hypothetical protein